MTPLANAMHGIFIVSWFVAVGAWFYAMRYFMPIWLVGFRKREHHNGYVRKMLIGAGIFIAAVAVGLAAGGIAEYWGGGWD